jgi:tetratricopeptide (TPR) repeat protein
MPASDDWTALLELARSTAAAKDYDRAEQIYEQAADAAQHALGRGATEVYEILRELMHLQYCDIGDYARTEPVARRALALREEQFGPDSPELWPDLVALGYACQFGGKADEAEDAFRRAASVTEAALGPQHPETHKARGQFFQYLRNARKYEQLEKLLRPLVDRGPAAETGVAPPIATLAEILKQQGRWAEAEPLYRRLLAQSEQTNPQNERGIAQWSRELGDALHALGRPGEAAALYERALALQQTEMDRLLGSVPQDTKYAGSRQILRHARAIRTVELLRRYADALQAAGQLDDANAAYERALTIIEALSDESGSTDDASATMRDRLHGQVLADYARVRRELGRADSDDIERRATALVESAESRRQSYLQTLSQRSTHHQ